MSNVLPPPPDQATATSLLQFAEEATEVRFAMGALVCAHVAPESEETKIGLGAGTKGNAPTAPTTATSLRPSADAATADQFVMGALVGVQESPEFLEV